MHISSLNSAQKCFLVVLGHWVDDNDHTCFERGDSLYHWPITDRFGQVGTPYLSVISCVGLPSTDVPWCAARNRVAKVYNDAAEKLGKEGRIYGIEGDIRTKVTDLHCTTNWSS